MHCATGSTSASKSDPVIQFYDLCLHVGVVTCVFAKRFHKCLIRGSTGISKSPVC
jgi:hypothetical protein